MTNTDTVTRLVYDDDTGIQPHEVPSEMADAVKECIRTKYGAEPYHTGVKDCFNLDPGGCARNNEEVVTIPLTTTKVQVRLSGVVGAKFLVLERSEPKVYGGYRCVKIGSFFGLIIVHEADVPLLLEGLSRHEARGIQAYNAALAERLQMAGLHVEVPPAIAE